MNLLCLFCVGVHQNFRRRKNNSIGKESQKQENMAGSGGKTSCERAGAAGEAPS